MTLERPPLFSKRRDALIFFSLACLLFLLSVSLKYFAFNKLTRFNDADIRARVINQYTKTTPKKEYTVLKLRSDGITFYTTAPPQLRNLIGRDLTLNVWVKPLTFLEYLKGFYLHSNIIKVFPKREARTIFAHYISQEHTNPLIGELFATLFSASPTSKELRDTLSTLGISHLLAISGFHLGIISALLYFLLRYPYRLLQEHYFPYRSAHRDLFVVVLLFLTAYLYFLGAIPSLLRAFVMLIIGFILYDRGIKLISMQSLLLTITLLIALMPSLLFNVGFWLSVTGVFYIFLYLIHFKSSRNILNFIGLSLWVYLMMLPLSLYLFGNFSIYHPLSILATLLFLPFYIISTLLHLIAQGDYLDDLIDYYLSLAQVSHTITLSPYAVVTTLTLSLFAIKHKTAAYLLVLCCTLIFIGAVYHVTEL
jgi:competence protein ComEC